MTTLAELAAMLDAATGPSRELDCVISQVLQDRGDCSPIETYVDSSSLAKEWYLVRDPHGWPESRQVFDVDCFTDSIDAAEALRQRKLPDRLMALCITDSVSGSRLTSQNGDDWEMECEAPTAPLAILKALIAALIAKGEADHD